MSRAATGRGQGTHTNRTDATAEIAMRLTASCNVSRKGNSQDSYQTFPGIGY
jgi:hypothetical protein